MSLAAISGVLRVEIWFDFGGSEAGGAWSNSLLQSITSGCWSYSSM